jgi:hypothetical protein
MRFERVWDMERREKIHFSFKSSCNLLGCDNSISGYYNLVEVCMGLSQTSGSFYGGVKTA